VSPLLYQFKPSRQGAFADFSSRVMVAA